MPEIEIPASARDETLGQWCMAHPDPDRLSLSFNVPTPSERELAWERWIRRFALLAWIGAVAWHTLPSVEVFVLVTFIPLGLFWFLSDSSPLVQSLAIDRTAGTLTVVALVHGRPESRTVLLLRVRGVRYVAAHHSPQYTRGATIEIDLAPPAEPIVLKRLGLLQHAELCEWLSAMVVPKPAVRSRQ